MTDILQCKLHRIAYSHPSGCPICLMTPKPTTPPVFAATHSGAKAMNRMGRKNPLPSSRAVIIIMWLAMFIGFVGFILDPKNNMVPSKEEQGAKE